MKPRRSAFLRSQITRPRAWFSAVSLGRTTEAGFGIATLAGGASLLIYAEAVLGQKHGSPQPLSVAISVERIKRLTHLGCSYCAGWFAKVLKLDDSLQLIHIAVSRSIGEGLRTGLLRSTSPSRPALGVCTAFPARSRRDSSLRDPCKLTRFLQQSNIFAEIERPEAKVILCVLASILAGLLTPPPKQL